MLLHVRHFDFPMFIYTIYTPLLKTYALQSRSQFFKSGGKGADSNKLSVFLFFSKPKNARG